MCPLFVNNDDNGRAYNATDGYKCSDDTPGSIGSIQVDSNM